MKKHHTENAVSVVVYGETTRNFVVPHCATPRLLAFLKYIQEQVDDDSVPVDEAFKHLHQKYGKVGATIRGARARDEMTQAELARRLNIRQAHVSAMEHGKRTIGKAMARKLAKIFNTDYRLFL
jgi:DNA-binding XRE family transcriptional regulator